MVKYFIGQAEVLTCHIFNCDQMKRDLVQRGPEQVYALLEGRVCLSCLKPKISPAEPGPSPVQGQDGQDEHGLSSVQNNHVCKLTKIGNDGNQVSILCRRGCQFQSPNTGDISFLNYRSCYCARRRYASELLAAREKEKEETESYEHSDNE